MATATIQTQTNAFLDDTISSGSPTTNYATGAVIYVGNTGSDTTRTLIKPDFTVITDFVANKGNIQVASAILTLTYREDYATNARVLSVYRALRAWNVAQATWNVYTTGNNWGTAGCSNTTSDREATNIGTANQAASPTPGTTLDITLNAAAIQAMINGTFTNNGLLLQVATETEDQIGYDSGNAVTDTNRPKLVITYSIVPSEVCGFYEV